MPLPVIAFFMLQAILFVPMAAAAADSDADAPVLPEMENPLDSTKPVLPEMENLLDSIKDVASGKETEPDIQRYKSTYSPVEYRPLRDTQSEWIDLGVLTALLSIGTWMVLRHVRSRWLLLLLFISLLYLGFWRGGCICPIGASSDTCHALFHPERIGRVTLLLFLTPLVFALLAGRVFCGGVCPLGAIQHLISRRTQPVKLPAWLDRLLMVGPIVVLATIAWNSVRGPSFLICRLDPFVTAFLFGKATLHDLAARVGMGDSIPVESAIPLAGDAAAWAFLCGVLVLCVVVSLPFCRYVCPFGAILGLISLVAFRRRTLDPSQCGNCGRCERVCPTQAISEGRTKTELRVNAYKCVQCGRCSDICHRRLFDHTHDQLPKRHLHSQ